MVKVFLCDSAEQCYDCLQKCVVCKNSVVLIPDEFFREQFLTFWPQFPKELLFTPSQLLKKLGQNPLPQVFMHWMPECFWINDSVCLNDKGWSEAVKGNWQEWLAVEKFCTLSSLKVTLSSIFSVERWVFFGNFPEEVITQWIKQFSVCNEFYVIKRDFEDINKVHIAETLSTVYTISVKNLAAQRFWLTKHVEKFSKVCVIDLHAAHTSVLVQKHRCHFEVAAWLDWQEHGTLGYFLIYLRIIVQEDALFKNYQNDLKGASEKCFTDDYVSLYKFLKSAQKHWIEPFVCENKPQQATLTEWWASIKDQVPSLLVKEVGEVYQCPLILSKAQFFDGLRRMLTMQAEEKSWVLGWKDAQYLPIKGHCLLLNGVKTSAVKDQKIMHWIQEIAQRTSKVEICAPLLNDKNDVQDPLYPVTSTEVYEFNALGDTRQPFNALNLPVNRVNFSCKNWERFYLCPRNTWLKTILKTQSLNVSNDYLKAKIIGEWVHENLQFKFMPRSVDDWKANVLKNSEQRWCYLNKLNVPFLIKQWHERALAMSLKMTNSCASFFKKEWCVYSEWPLPNHVALKGRVDFLAVNAVEKEAVVVDFKTSLHYLFTPYQMSRGHALQLFLYGQQIQNLFEKVTLMVVRRDGQATMLNFSEVEMSVQGVLDWMKQIQTTGCYEMLPEESLEDLPLCYV